MATEYKLSYMASDINSKLGQISTLQNKITGTVGQFVIIGNDGAQPIDADVARTSMGAMKAKVNIFTITESTTLDLTHTESLLRVNSSNEITITIPLNSSVAFAIGSCITITKIGTGDVTISPLDGVTLNSKDSARTIDGQFGAVTLYKVATDEWDMWGALEGGVRLPPVGTSLNDCTWEQIRMISDAGKASEYFSVGDRKAVALNGTVGSLSLSGTYYCYIIGIDHNSAKEGANRIHFQFGCTDASGGVHIAFIDSGYNMGKTSNTWFNMNNAMDNRGGWANSRMRTTIIPTFKSCLPSDLQAVLKTVTKYSDNTGGGSDTASYVTATTDDIFLLSEFEVFGTRTHANSAEKNYQAQYAYYSADNSKVRYHHSSTGSTAYWWLRSVYAAASSYFCFVSTSGSASASDADHSYGFAPAFCV